MFYINWKLMLTAFISVPTVTVLSKAFGAIMRRLSKKTQKALAKSNSSAEEAIAAVRTVKSFAAEREESSRYSHELKEYQRLTMVTAGYYSAYAALTFTFLPQVPSLLLRPAPSLALAWTSLAAS